MHGTRRLASLPPPAKEYVSIQPPSDFPTALLNLTVPRLRALVLLITVSCICEHRAVEQACYRTDGRPMRDLRSTVCLTEVRAVRVSECSVIILVGQEQDSTSLRFSFLFSCVFHNTSRIAIGSVWFLRKWNTALFLNLSDRGPINSFFIR